MELLVNSSKGANIIIFFNLIFSLTFNFLQSFIGTSLKT